MAQKITERIGRPLVGSGITLLGSGFLASTVLTPVVEVIKLQGVTATTIPFVSVTILAWIGGAIGYEVGKMINTQIWGKG